MQQVIQVYREQYADRINSFRDHGFMETQTPFWRLESYCRKTIEQAALGWRLKPGMSEGFPRTMS